MNSKIADKYFTSYKNQSQITNYKNQRKNNKSKHYDKQANCTLCDAIQLYYRLRFYSSHDEF